MSSEVSKIKNPRNIVLASCLACFEASKLILVLCYISYRNQPLYLKCRSN